MKINFNINVLFIIGVSFIFTSVTKSIETEEAEQPFTTATLAKTELLDNQPLTQLPQESLFHKALNLSGTMVGYAKSLSLQESYERDLEFALLDSQRTAELEADTRRAVEDSKKLYEREQEIRHRKKIEDELQGLRDLRKFYWDEETNLNKELFKKRNENYQAIVRGEKRSADQALQEEIARIEKLLTENRNACRIVWDQIIALDAQWLEMLAQRARRPIEFAPSLADTPVAQALPTALSEASPSTSEGLK